MELDNKIIDDINNILNIKENDYIIKDINFQNDGQIKCSVPKKSENKKIIYAIQKIEEKIINVFNFKIDFNSDIIKNVKEIKDNMKEFKEIIEKIKIEKTFPNNIESNEKIKKIISLYKKYGKELEKYKKEIVDKTNNYLDLLMKLSGLMKNLNEIIKINIRKFEDLSTKIEKEENNDKKVEEYFFQIFDSYKKIIESFKLYENFFSEVKDTEKNVVENIFNNLNPKIIYIKNEINNYQKEFPDIIENYFPLINLKIKDDLNKISKDLKKQFQEFQKFRINGGLELSDQNIIRLDLLIILDITNSMGKYLSFLKNNLNKIIDQIKDKCPLYLIYLGFIGYKDFADLELGDEYIDIDFTLNYDSVFNKIKDIDEDGGDDIPEDIAGAFKMAQGKKWGEGQKLIILITDSPCHGTDYHNLDQSKEEYKDKYPAGYYEGEERSEEYERVKIDNYVKFFAKNDISMICFQILNITDKMYNIFKDIYEKEKKPELFSIEKNNIDKIIINKALEIYKKEEEKLINKLLKKYQ